MDLSDIFAGILVLLTCVVFVFVFSILGILVGAFVGWCISWNFLGDWVAQGFRAFGFETRASLIEIGAMLGFIGGLIKGASYSHSETEEKS